MGELIRGPLTIGAKGGSSGKYIRWSSSASSGSVGLGYNNRSELSAFEYYALGACSVLRTQWIGVLTPLLPNYFQMQVASRCEEH
ncbi:hypothetical protein PIB30_039888 [Stylosanthes scabra]|uniref:Uncharacterized protein n=1 Tax=Stylosanthes scabra TaxID=79078 RepID=A0ABU6XC33_9FABA|nr:hypothetical protein [Stylosanthes scabra]